MLYILVAAAVFGICFAVDKGFTKSFRNQAQHKTGLSVRLSKRYAVFGLFLTVIGILAVCVGLTDESVLLWGGVIVLLMGLGLVTYYMTFGIFYDADSFILTTFGKKSVVYILLYLFLIKYRYRYSKHSLNFFCSTYLFRLSFLKNAK